MQRFIEDQFLPQLLKASSQAAVVILLVLAAQWVFGRRLSPRWRYGLWLLVALRLILPVTISSDASLFNLRHFSRPAKTLIAQPASSVSLAADSSISDSAQMPVPRDPHSKSQSDELQQIFPFLALAWATGAAVMTLCFVITHYRLSRRVCSVRSLIDTRVLNLLEDCKQQMGVRMPVALVETNAVDGPCLFGFLRPRLLLPPGFTQGFSDGELRHVFLHELGHVKRHDIFVGWLMAVLQVLHWFNPLVWVAFARMRVDRELACDALVLSRSKDEDFHLYGRTILKLLENLRNSVKTPGLAGIAEDKKQMKERILMISKFQKTNHGPALTGLLYAALGLLSLTDAKSTDKATSMSADPYAPPRIVSTSPEVGATDIDPSVTEISVTFDQDMKTGLEWTGSNWRNEYFPNTPKGVTERWLGKRTCVLPVKLEAGHYYCVPINPPGLLNFRSVAGERPRPLNIYFTTQGASDEAKAKMQPPRVSRFDPENGTQDVNPALTELRFTFNVPMNPRHYLLGSIGKDGHNLFKTEDGRNSFWSQDKKTFVFPVHLKPGLSYRLKLDDDGYGWFETESGVHLEPVTYNFATGEENAESAKPTVNNISETATRDSGDGWDFSERLKMAKAGNQWAIYDIWDAYYRGKHGVAPDRMKADQWLISFVKDTWIVRFEPIGGFTPHTPGEFLERIDQFASTYSDRARIGENGFLRTTKRGDRLVASFLSNYPDLLKISLAKVPDLKVTSVEPLTPEEFIKYEESPQESL